MKLTKKPVVKLSDNTAHYIFIEFLVQLHGLQMSTAGSD